MQRNETLAAGDVIEQGLFLLGRRLRGNSLGIVLAYCWAAYPFSLYALSSNSNDSLVALLVVAGVAAAIGFGLPGLQIIFSGPTPPPASAPATPTATTAPTASPNASVLPSPAPTSQVPLDLGTPTALAQARASVTFDVFVPEPIHLGGTGPAVFLDDRVLGGAVVLAYPPSGPLASEGGTTEKSIWQQRTSRSPLRTSS